MRPEGHGIKLALHPVVFLDLLECLLKLLAASSHLADRWHGWGLAGQLVASGL